MNIYPYNFQPKIHKQAEKVTREETPPQQDNADFKDNRSFKNSREFEYSPQKTVNIKNIIEDFRKTLAAIDASEDVNDEVSTYLKLVDTQARKEKPSSKLIKANLTNAAGILDEYITETLNKPSKVVTEWINALLLQKIDYKAAPVAEDKAIPDQPETPPAFSPDKQDIVNEQPVKSSPENQKLENLYKKIEKLTDRGKFEQALLNYDKILPNAQKLGNKRIETKIYLDKAYIYDINKDFPSALKNYHKAANIAFETGNNRTQAICHYNIGSIYDEFGEINLALNHYYAALSLDGQVENLQAQTRTLNDVGNIFSYQKKYKTAFEHYQVGISLTRETNDLKGRSYLFSNIGSMFKKTGKDESSLRFYKKSIECDLKTGNIEGYSINYEHAGDIMNRNNRLKKAKALYEKSLAAAQKLEDRELAARLIEKINGNNISY